MRCLRVGGRLGGVLAVHVRAGHAVLPFRDQLHDQLRRGKIRRGQWQLPASLSDVRRALRQLSQRSGLHQLRDGRAALRDNGLLVAVLLRLLRGHRLDLRGLLLQLRLLLCALDLHFLRTARRAAVLPLLGQRLLHELPRRALRHDQQRRLPLRSLSDRLRFVHALGHSAVLGVHDGGHDQLLPLGHLLPRRLPRGNLQRRNGRQTHLQRMHRALCYLLCSRHLCLQLLRNRQTNLCLQHLRLMSNRTVR